MDKIKKILILSTVIIVILLIIFLAISIVRLKSLQLDYGNAMTISELEYSQDSLFKAMDSVRRILKIKDKNLNQIQYIKYEIRVTDTLELVDTIFIKPSFYMDTTLSDKWHSTRIMMKYPSYIMVEPSLESDKYVVFSFKKETVKPPRKFFLFRWFQKKQKVVNVDVVETNPYITNKAQRFMEVVK